MAEKNEITDAGWNFDNSYARLSRTFYTKINPAPVRSPKLIILNQSLSKDLGLNTKALQSDFGIEVFAGNQIPEGAYPLAQAYAGHQFVYFTMLGDGRAILIGEHNSPEGKKVDIQLKGSGRTPYSRRGDGRAALGPMLREYIISEAMQALGIPTTRSLAVVTTGETIYRETELPGAILTRVASSHIRVGTFQYALKWGTLKELRELADYTIQRHYPEVWDNENRYLYFLKEVIKRQASLIAKWQLVGFIHGVMNTDNMALSGETIDYGPCAFMDIYDPSTVFSSIDIQGRYAYGNQPEIAAWNLSRFAETLIPLVDEDAEKASEFTREAISGFRKMYHDHWVAGMRAKLGLYSQEQEDEDLMEELLHLMKEHKADYTNTFRLLTIDKIEESEIYQTIGFKQWYDKWQTRLGRQEESKEQVHQKMMKHNPAVIPRNHRVEEALEAAVYHEDYRVMERLLHVLSNPFGYTVDQLEYTTLPEAACIPYRTFCGT